MAWNRSRGTVAAIALAAVAAACGPEEYRQDTEPARQLPEPTPPALDPGSPLQAPGDTVPSADRPSPRPPATPEATPPGGDARPTGMVPGEILAAAATPAAPADAAAPAAARLA